MEPIHPIEPSWAARFAAGWVRAYQVVLSPMQRLAGPVAGCRFSPGCSEYARQALLAHGFWRGSWLAARRLGKCQPFHPGGLDPVPEPRRYVAGRMWRPRTQA